MTTFSHMSRTFVVAVLMMLPVTAFAQEATIVGSVSDSTGGVLPGVTIKAVHDATGNSFETVTDSRGQYRLPVRTGAFHLTAALQGFAAPARTFELLLGQEATVNLVMAPSTLQESVTVTGDSPLVDFNQSKLGGNIDPRQMQELPVNGRNWQDLAILSPGSRTNAVTADSPTVIGSNSNTQVGSYQLNLDGKAFRPDGMPAATLIPPAFGMAGVNLHTWGGGWGTVTYWNAFVANLELQGQGTFFDARLNDPDKYPVAARAGFGNKRSENDMVSSKLAALQFYQLAIPPPTPPRGSFDRAAARRGEIIFNGKATCSQCHVPPLFTEPGWNAHKASEIGIDDFQANRSPDNSYRTTPLRGLFAHMKRGFYHDGRFATLLDVVDHYNSFKRLDLSGQEKNDLVEYLKSL